MSLTGQPVRQKRPPTEGNPAYLAAIHDLPCCICDAFGLPQMTPTEAHHVCHDRFEDRRTPDEMAIPLCRAHHTTGEGAKLALHRCKALWREVYGADYDYTPATQDKLAHMMRKVEANGP